MNAQIGQLVRELLAGDLRSYPERTRALDEPGWNAFSEIVGAAFYRAVEGRFGAPPAAAESPDGESPDGEAGHGEVDASGTGSAVGGFVASAATAYEGTRVAIDVVAGEALVRSVLGDTAGVSAVLEELDEPDLARIELVLLRKLIDDAGEAGESVDALVSTAQSEAAQFSGEAAST